MRYQANWQTQEPDNRAVHAKQDSFLRWSKSDARTRGFLKSPHALPHHIPSTDKRADLMKLKRDKKKNGNKKKHVCYFARQRNDHTENVTLEFNV